LAGFAPYRRNDENRRQNRPSTHVERVSENRPQRPAFGNSWSCANEQRFGLMDADGGNVRRLTHWTAAPSKARKSS
jgi:hypothetical protein